MNKIIKFSDFPDAYILGRTDVTDEGALQIYWPNSGFQFNTDSSFIKIYFNAYQTELQPAYVKCTYNDKEEIHAISTGKEVIYLRNLSGITNFTFRRIMDPEGIISINHIEVEAGAKFFPVEKLPKKMLFIGDSITVGFGIQGDPDNSVYNSADSNSTETYAFKTAKEFQAEIMACAWSGRGLVSDCRGNRSAVTLREAFLSRNPMKDPYDHSKWIPDVIIINAGTNDQWGGVSNEEFYEAAMDLLHMIEEKYPGKPIVYFYGAMDDRKLPTIEKAMADFKLTHPNSYFKKTDPLIDKREYMGSVGHPNIKKNDEMKEELVSLLKTIDF